MTRICLLPVVGLILLSCNSSDDKPINKFSDPVLLRIADLRDRRQSDSLIVYFGHENAAYRRDAVAAFGSLQDSSVLDMIGKLLVQDADEAVRKAAAFAMGQIQHSAAEQTLMGALVKEKSPAVVFEILQAYGRATLQWKVDTAPLLDDTTKTAGLAWSIYRAGLRGKADASANEVARGLLDKKYSYHTRLGAAHFFARGAKDFEAAEGALIGAATQDESADIRMAAALALGKIQTDSALTALKAIMKSEKDPRVLVNTLRALSHFPYDKIKNYLYPALSNKDANVGIAASEVVTGAVRAEDWIEVSSLTQQVKHWRIQANLYRAALSAGQNKDLAAEIMQNFSQAGDAYQQAAFMQALGDYPPAYSFAEKNLLASVHTVVRTAAATTLVSMNRSKHFKSSLREVFADIYVRVLKTEDDPAILGTIAMALADSTLGFRTLIKDTSPLYEAKKKLRLPQHSESLQPLEEAIAHLEGRKAPVINNPFNHPINWDLVKTTPADQLATIKTSRGNIVIRLFVNESPGSVANFIELARRDYFDNKFFHRVVPNFVIQGGCNRGDGWGSEDYSIRSEFTDLLYGTGSVGMASSGKDTEGTQWFITHSPTPHLDGKYTIFAEVTQGMPVVNFIQVGDKITDIEIHDAKAQ